MSKFAVSFMLLFLGWLALTFTVNVQEVILGLFISLVIAHISNEFFFHKKPLKPLNPVRWIHAVAYIFVFIWMEIISHLELAYRIITGKISPGIIKLETGHATDVGKVLLANSITLTPGTLTIKAGKNLYVHWIGFEEKKERSFAKHFESFGRRLAND